MANSFTYKEFAAILRDMKNWMVANQDVITDFNPSSTTYQLLQAVASEIARLYLEARSGFDLQMVNLAFSVFGFTPNPAIAGTGLVTLTSPTAPLVNVPVPTGFMFTIGGQSYVTTADATLLAGQTSVIAIPFQAVVAGVSGNVPQSAVISLVSSIPPINGGSLQGPVINGVDIESNPSVLSRFRLFISGLGRCTTTGLVAGALGVSGVRSAVLAELIPGQNQTYTDPISGLSVTKMIHGYLFVETGQGYASAAVLAAVQSAIEGSDGNGGMRAAGVKIVAQAPALLSVPVTAIVTVSPLYPQMTLLSLIQVAVTTYLNNIPIGGGFIFNELVQAVMSVPGVEDVAISTPTENIAGVAAQVIRAGALNFALTVGW